MTTSYPPPQPYAKLAMRVWWIPQVPGKPFFVDVPDPATGKLVCDLLARYDLFQFENRIKPDYCNAGGLQVLNIDGDGEWVDFDVDDDEDMQELDERLARL